MRSTEGKRGDEEKVAAMENSNEKRQEAGAGRQRWVGEQLGPSLLQTPNTQAFRQPPGRVGPREAPPFLGLQLLRPSWAPSGAWPTRSVPASGSLCWGKDLRHQPACVAALPHGWTSLISTGVRLAASQFPVMGRPALGLLLAPAAVIAGQCFVLTGPWLHLWTVGSHCHDPLGLARTCGLHHAPGRKEQNLYSDISQKPKPLF